MEDKSKLLDELKIDRSDDNEPRGISVPVVLIGLVIALLLGGGASYFLLQGQGAGQGSGEAGSSSAAKVARTQTSPVQESQPSVSGTVAEGMTQTDTGTVTPASERLLNASGYITARRIATVSAEIMGLLTDVRVEEGMTVTRGQVLATLDAAVASVNLQFAEAQVAVQEARMESAAAELAEARRVLTRVTELKKEDFSSTADVTRAQASVASLEAQLKRSAADIEVAKFEAARQRERLNDHTIRAPFDGVVTVKNAQPGEIVSPSSAGGGFTRTGICTIVDMDSLEIEVDVNEAFIGRVSDGQRVAANLDAYPEWTIPASVIAIIPTADRAKATVRVRIRIEEKDPRILPDMGVKVAFLRT